MNRITFSESIARPGRRTWSIPATPHALALACALRLLQPQRASAEDHFDLKHEWYAEDDHRVEVNTTALEIEKKLAAATIARAKLVYDSISGASPTGGPPPAGSSQVPVKELHDIRRAVNFDLSQQCGRHTLTPSFAYSLERDYESYGVGYTHAIDFNQKNTTLSLGVAGAFDSIFAKPLLGRNQYKKSGDILLGFTQLLGPKTILTVNLTAGLADGYLSDPYKGMRFTYYPDPDALFPEQRPRERTKAVGYVALKHYFMPLRGSGEVEYRLHRASYGITSHTIALNWNQKLGDHLLLAPTIRFTDQSAAKFYAVELPGDPSCPRDNPLCPDIAIPRYYSADYRLSALQTWTFGVKATVILTDHVSFDLAYRRYTMRGTDHVTSPSAYPSAHVLTGGLTIWF